jgi:predicted PurR-regulated permease PerM
MEPTTRIILRTVLIVVTVVFTLFILYQLRKPLSWIVIAGFIAVAVSGPVNLLQRRMKRGFAIAIVYLTLILIPIVVAAVLIPGLVRQGEDLVNNVPGYAQDVTEFVNDNETLSDLNDKYSITKELESAASEAPSKLGDAAGTLRDIGVGIVSSIFAGITILILSIFMVAAGPRWTELLLQSQPPDRRERIQRALARIAAAVGGYVGGVLVQATIAAVLAFVVLTILGAPFAGALALIIFFFDLIPVVGATIASVIVGIVLLFVNFPVALIIWVVYAIAFQQIENYVIQPQIQKRATAVEPFIILVAVLFGVTLFGVPGAILAIPTAASIQIGIREYLAYRRAEGRPATDGDSDGESPPPGPEPEPAPA